MITLQTHLFIQEFLIRQLRQVSQILPKANIMLLCLLGHQQKRKGKLFQANGGTFYKTSDQNNEGIYQIKSMSEQVKRIGEGQQSHFRCNEPNPEYTQRRVNQDAPFTTIPKEIGMEQDSVVLAMIIFEFFARQDGELSEAWVVSINQAIAGGIDGVLNLMQRLPGDAGMKQPVAIRRFSTFIYDSLKPNNRTGILGSLCTKAMTLYLHFISPN